MDDGHGARHDGADENPDVDPREMLALLESEKARAASALGPDPRLLFGIWGAAWLIGLGTFWAAASDKGPALPMTVAGVVFGASIVAAIALTMIHTVHRVVGVRGVSRTTGAMYGWSWFLGFGALATIMQGAIRAGVPGPTIGLLWTVLSGLVVGVLYMAGGALWQDRLQFGLGAWILIASAAGALAGYPSVYLVMALGGGGGFLLAAAWFAVRGRRA